ncbi:hypothetical protein HMI55_000796 [Coelomomyces lativittatus]|nr:hypothetical protein HMI55_000796 [Coelomomyces lativittatus]
MLGIDFTVGGNNNSDVQLAMRDYRPTTNRTSGGVVALYALNETNNKFFQTNLFSAADAGTTSDWKNEDFFGVGLSLVTEVLPILHIGAPGSSVLHRFIKSKTRWELDALTSNPGFVERSFFSGFLANSQDSRFVLVSNAVTSQGPGIVYLHHRKLPGYHLLDFSEEFSAVSTGYLAYDWIATLKKSNSTDTKYLQDQFGKVASAAGPWIVVGAPVEGCVYTFAAPVAAPLTPGVTPTDIINNLTTEPTTNYGLYIGIGVALAFLVILPILVLLIIRRHKKKMLTQFALNDAKNIGNPPEPEAS